MKIPNGLCIIFFTNKFEETNKYFKKVAKDYNNSEIKFYTFLNSQSRSDYEIGESIIFFNNRVEILSIPNNNNQLLEYETNKFFLEQKSNCCDRIRIMIEIILDYFEEK